MSYKIKTMSKEQLGRICQGGKDAIARLEAQESHEPLNAMGGITHSAILSPWPVSVV